MILCLSEEKCRTELKLMVFNGTLRINLILSDELELKQPVSIDMSKFNLIVMIIKWKGLNREQINKTVVLKMRKSQQWERLTSPVGKQRKTKGFDPIGSKRHRQPGDCRTRTRLPSIAIQFNFLDSLSFFLSFFPLEWKQTTRRCYLIASCLSLCVKCVIPSISRHFHIFIFIT